MRLLTITFSMLLIGTGLAQADEFLARTNKPASDRFGPVYGPPRGRPTTFPATLKKIDGHKITLIRQFVAINPKEKPPKEKEETLIATADCTMLESRPNKENHTVDMIPLEGGLKGHIDIKDFVIAQVTVNQANKIVEIRAGGDGWPAKSSRYQVVVQKIDGDKIRIKRPPWADETLTVAPACKVFEASFVKEGLPLVTQRVVAGLKAKDLIKEPVRTLITTDKEHKVVEVCILRPHPHRFEAAIKKIEGNKLTLVKHLYNGNKGNEEALSAAAACEVFEYRFDKGSRKFNKVPYEPALKCDFLTMKRVELRFHTDKEQKVTRINVLHNPYWYEAVVKMDKLDRVRIFKEKKDASLSLAEYCKIFQGRVDRDTAKTKYSLEKDGIKGAIVLKRPFHAMVKQNDEDKVTEMRFHRDPANFVAYVSKVEKKEEGESIISIFEPALSGPGSKLPGAYHSKLTASKDCRVFQRKSVGGKSILEPVPGNDPLVSLYPRIKGPRGGTQFVVARILLGDKGKVKEVQILDGVSSVEQVK